MPVDPIAGVAEGIVDERIAKVLMEADELVVAMELLAAVNRADALHEGLGSHRHRWQVLAQREGDPLRGGELARCRSHAVL